MALAAILPYDHPYAGGYPGLGSQRLPTDGDCLTYLAAVAAADGAGVETGVAVAVDEFFRATKAAGVFSALKASCILCGARTITGALVPLAGSAPSAEGGWAAGDYSRTTGLQGDGNALYLDSNYLDNADDDDDNHRAVYHSAGGDTGGLIGVRTDDGVTPFNGTHIFQNLTSAIARNRSTILASHSVNDGTVSTFSGMSRSGSSGYVFRSQGTSDVITQNSDVSARGINVRVFGRNHDLVQNLFDGSISFYSIGTDIGSAGLAALDTAVDNLLTAIGEAL
jgi:hypothetical protein